METKLYIGNMSYETSEEELRTLFSEAGTVGSVDIIRDRDTGRPKGFAFISMNTQAEAEKAISLFNQKTIHARALTVNIARRREERSGAGRPQSGLSYRNRRGSNNRY